MMARLAELGWGKRRPRVPPVLHHASSFPAARPSSTTGSTSSSASPPRRRTRRASCASSTQIDVAALLPQVDCPTLVLHASRDARVPFDEGRLIAGQIPGARFVPIESAQPPAARAASRLAALARRGARPSCRRRLAAIAPFAALTPRERELLELIAQGRDNAQIAATLGLSREDGAQPHHQHLRQARGREPRAGDRAGARSGLRITVAVAAPCGARHFERPRKRAERETTC